MLRAEQIWDISIHALREEGDASQTRKVRRERRFLSTPSARRATTVNLYRIDKTEISIHALREEGDGQYSTIQNTDLDFYPRPPRGGRRQHDFHVWRIHDISIHALREEGDIAALVQ